MKGPEELGRPRPVALVTGASRGLGASIAVELASCGHPVAVNYASSVDQAAAVVEEITQQGGRAAAFGADVTSPLGVTDLTERVTRELGPIGVLVLNATGPQPSIAARDLDWQRDLLPMLEYFVLSPLLLTQAVVPAMVDQQWGRIIHIGSDVVQRAPTGNAAYVAAKSAQLGLARTSSQELGVHGITVNVVSPGWIPVERHDGVSSEEFESYSSSVPLRRLGVPREVASAVAWLASAGASYVNGVNLNVNGGKTT